MDTELKSYLKEVASHNASDLFLSVGARPGIKIDGVTKALNAEPLNTEHMNTIVHSCLTPDEMRAFDSELELNKAIQIDGVGRFRLNLYRQRGNYALVARYIKSEIPNLKDLGLPPSFQHFIMENSGLILIVGAAGSGKSTTMASMIDHRNRKISGHILCVEDPVEYIHQHNKSIVDQREIGTDTQSFSNALRNAMRQAPDVIVVGETRDRESMKHAVTYAETGHLCVSTLHANNANQAFERILGFFPEDQREQLLLELSLHLKFIIAQRLVRSKDGKRVPIVEVMRCSPYISDLIKHNRIHEIHDAMTRNDSECITFDHSVFDLYKQGVITKEEAIEHSDSKADLGVDIRLFDQTQKDDKSKPDTTMT